MSERRKALIGKFQAMTHDRLTRMAVTLMELEQGHAGNDELERVARELHTLKGESRMLGFEALSAVAHAAEDRLRRDAEGRSAGSALLEPNGGGLLRQAVELMLRAVGQDDAPVDELIAVSRLLGEQAEPPASGGPGRMAARAAGSPNEPPAPRTRASAERWVQVRGTRIEELCEEVSSFAERFRSLTTLCARAAADAPAIPGARAREIPERTLRGMLEQLDDCGALLGDLTEAAWSLRLTPVEPLLDEMSKHARELAIGMGKRVRVETSGAGVELERTIIDAVWEPVLHLVRNAVGHGVEAPPERGEKRPDATLRFAADSVGANVVLSVEDDGRGVDWESTKHQAIARGFMSVSEAAEAGRDELVALLFAHGFSTRAQADELSGRGVGLDVVRRTIESLGGSVSVETELGAGTRFALTVPTTITKERALVVDQSGTLFGFPCRSILEVVALPRGQVAVEPDGRATLHFRGEACPLHSLGELLADGVAPRGRPDRWAVVVEAAGRQMAFGVGAMLGERELLRRATDGLLARLDYVAASSTVEDGRAVIVLLIPGLVRRAEAHAGAARNPRDPDAAVEPARAAAKTARMRVLLVDDSEIVCDLVSEMLVSSGFDVEVALGPEAALAAVARRVPDLLVTDLDMPGMSGIDLVSRVRTREPALPVIVLSARRADQTAEVVARLGAAYLEKSTFHKRTLLEAIERSSRAR